MKPTAALRHLLIALGVFLAMPVAASSSLKSFAVAAGGRANATFDPPCTGGGAPPQVYNFFGGWGVGVPTAGYDDCGIVGGWDDQASTTGPLPADHAVTSSWPVGNTFSGSGHAVTNYGVFYAHAHSEFSGEFWNINSTGADGMGITEDDFTITSPSHANGQSGTVRFHIRLTGAFSRTAAGQVGVQISNRVNHAGLPYQLFSGHSNGGNSEPTVVYSWAGQSLTGFTHSQGGLSGSDVILSAQIPIVFGTPFTYELGLLTEAVSALTSIVDSEFLASITRIEVAGPGAEPVTDFVVASGSGTFYGPSGTTAVAELLPDARSPVSISAFPNPARGAFELQFTLPQGAASELRILDASGRCVRQLHDMTTQAGFRSARWDGRDANGGLVPSGIYFARLSWDGRSTTTRLTLVR